jgi:hypothetical protein
MTFTYNGVKGSIQYRARASGQLRVNGSKLSGVTQSSTFSVTSKINGTSFSLPLPKVQVGNTAPWIGYTSSGSTLTLLLPSPGGSWSMTKTSRPARARRPSHPPAAPVRIGKRFVDKSP